MMRAMAKHVSVLANEVLDALDPQPGQTVVDCTVGLGGHSAALLARIKPTGRLIGFDFDPHNLAIARELLQFVGGQFELRHTNFAALSNVLMELGIEKV